MATKAKVLKVLKAQGAEWEVEQQDPFVFSAWLPDDKIWNSGYGAGIVTQEKDDSESWSKFWDDILAVVDAPVIDKEGGKQ